MRTLLVALATMMGAGACEQGSSAPPTDPGPDPSAPAFSVSASTTSLTAPRGWNAIVNFSVARRPNYAQPVTLSVEGLPAFVTASFTTPTLPATSSSTRLNLEVDSMAAPGTFTFGVRATGANATTTVTSLAFTVPRPSFSIVMPTGVSTSTSGPRSASVSIFITRENSFGGAVEFAVSGVPAGVTISSSYTIVPATRNGSFFLTAGPTAIAGTYTLTVRATGPEADERTGTVAFTILPLP